MSEELRHHCRRCRVRLAEPVSNPLDSFCCRGCIRLHFKAVCVICEGKKSGKGLACNHPRCQSALAAKRRYGTMGRLLGSGRAKLGSKTSNSIALARADDGVAKTPGLIGGRGFRHVAGPALSAVEVKALAGYWPETYQDSFTPEQCASARALRRSEFARLA